MLSRWNFPGFASQMLDFVGLQDLNVILVIFAVFQCGSASCRLFMIHVLETAFSRKSRSGKSGVSFAGAEKETKNYG